MRALNSDEAVMRNLTGRPATDAETVGWWGLGACAWDTTTANLGYRLSTAHWGSGLATEGARTLLCHAFGAAGLASVWASTTPANTASQRVLGKLSMRYRGIRYDQCQYEITAQEWAPADAQ